MTDPIKQELLPCIDPKCGGKCKITSNRSMQSSTISCSDCNLILQARVSEEDLIAIWSTRHQTDTGARALLNEKRIKNELVKGSGFWKVCGGCFETIDGHSSSATDKVFGCQRGSGCSDCGGIGAIWDNTEYSDYGEEVKKTQWHDGYPNKIYGREWFIAITEWGDRVVLRGLYEEHNYDFTTADGTHFKKEKIKKWMQFPDSNFIPFQAKTLPTAPESVSRDEVVEECIARVKVHNKWSCYDDVILILSDLKSSQPTGMQNIPYSDGSPSREWTSSEQVQNNNSIEPITGSQPTSGKKK